MIQKSYDNAITEFHKIQNQLPELHISKSNYVRHILSTDKGYWLSILNWDKHSKSPIHGHPDLAFVYIIDGEIRCTNYQESTLKPTKEHIYQSGDYFHSEGEKGKFNNAIHQVFAISSAQTLHFYSDNADKGYIF